VISNSELRERFVIRRAALHALRESKRRVLLANPYFVPDRGVLRALQRAAGRGVDVRLLLPMESDSTVLDLAARAVFAPLLAAGVRIWQSRSVVHTKVLAVDDAFVSIGSYNFDHRSLAYNLEMVVNVLDERASRDDGRDARGGHRGSEELTRENFGRGRCCCGCSSGSRTRFGSGSRKERPQASGLSPGLGSDKRSGDRVGDGAEGQGAAEPGRPGVGAEGFVGGAGDGDDGGAEGEQGGEEWLGDGLVLQVDHDQRGRAGDGQAAGEDASRRVSKPIASSPRSISSARSAARGPRSAAISQIGARQS
jgi:hypothetical protein